jgi:transposase
MMIRWSIWLDKKTVTVLKAMGEKRERSVGWIIRKAVEDFIERRKKDRSILDASPFELRRQLEYKTQWQGGLLVPVPPQNTSRKCPECQQVAAENRKSQAKFVCVECGFSGNADFVAAVNSREAGLASLACTQPSSAVRASCQEPTEGIPV